ncbi:hypothetical protein [Bacillus taeanensis]|uniref:Uncharacterized protein n=1 Tax=Bacillus taeanensis TaxID=273032 RepID=A0A366XYN3_9BACI|nr:hypothetical protein [Bacillus taeanensis]RBW69274.1 hypothetical protein DS031_12530 [Bacillus taeanensis]
MNSFFKEKISEAKVQFERTVDCKHIEFDDLYPYMSEQPQFFWYKRYVAWQELLTVTKLAGELEVDWKPQFTDKQVNYIEEKVLDAKVLDQWYEESQIETEEQTNNNEK